MFMNKFFYLPSSFQISFIAAILLCLFNSNNKTREPTGALNLVACFLAQIHSLHFLLCLIDSFVLKLVHCCHCLPGAFSCCRACLWVLLLCPRRLSPPYVPNRFPRGFFWYSLSGTLKCLQLLSFRTSLFWNMIFGSLIAAIVIRWKNASGMMLSLPAPWAREELSYSEWAQCCNTWAWHVHQWSGVFISWEHWGCLSKPGTSIRLAGCPNPHASN